MAAPMAQPWDVMPLPSPQRMATSKEVLSLPMTRFPCSRAVAAGTAALVAALNLGAGLPAQAQMALSQVRAANLARMQAERLNGGLTRYFTANCMHQKGGGACMVKSDAKGYHFNFLGGPPGWEVNGQRATVQTRILVNPAGTQVVTVEYNGAPR